MKLNLSCGKDIKEGWVNTDIKLSKGVDKILDLNKFPYDFEENTFDYILVRMVLEYSYEPQKVLEELWRISKDKAIIEIQSNNSNSLGSFNDFQYKSHFNQHAFNLMIDQPYSLEKIERFKIIEQKLIYTLFGKLLLFDWLREKLSHYLNGIISQTWIKLEVIK